MNINNVSAAPKSAEINPLERPMAAGSTPDKTNATKKTSTLSLVESKRQTAKLEEEQKKTFSADETKQLVEEMNEVMNDLQTSLGFSIREGLDHQVVVEISDRKTKEVIKQIPTEEMLTIKEKMEEFSGLLFDQKV